MSRPVIPDVTLACADPGILQCWKEKVEQGAKCSLLLKNSNGKIETILKCTSVNPKPKVQSSAPPASSPVKRKKRNEGNKKKRLYALLAYHQRLVVEKGMPTSRLMLNDEECIKKPTKATFKCPTVWRYMGRSACRVMSFFLDLM